MSCGSLSSTNHLKRFSEVKKVIIIYLEVILFSLYCKIFLKFLNYYDKYYAFWKHN